MNGFGLIVAVLQAFAGGEALASGRGNTAVIYFAFAVASLAIAWKQ